MKRFVMAVALASALSGPALAGIIPNTDYVPPPPPPPENMQTTSPDIPSTDYSQPPAESDLLSVLLTIMSVI